jgi:pimeloyl-ACP methyl ester carboxylesterase
MLPRESLMIETAAGPIEALVAEASSEAGAPPVLVLHGGMGGHDQALLLAQAALPDWRRHRVIAPSRAGYFGTPLAGGESPAAEADRHAALLDALGVKRAFVMAVSAGGPSALHFALRHPARCTGLVLISACSDTLEPPARMRQRVPQMQRMARYPWMLAPLRWRAVVSPESAARRSIPDAVLRRATLADPVAGPLLRQLQVDILTHVDRRMAGTINDMAQCAQLGAIPVDRLTVPVLMVHGTDDPVVPFAQSERVAQQAPSADLVALNGGGHVALFTHVRVVRVAVSGLLERVGN